MKFYYKTPIDYFLLSLDGKGLVTSASFEKEEVWTKNMSELSTGDLRDALDGYFLEKKNMSVRFISKEVTGTAYQKKVWAVIAKIPFGKTATYKEIATILGNEKASRAVGTACGKNPIALFLPCHRVVRTSGEDFSYSWGKERKEWLLKYERVL